MASDEEYLDGLMKSLMDADPDQNDAGSGGEDPLMDPDSAVSQVDDDEEWVARLDDLLMSAESMNQKENGSGADSGRSVNPADAKHAEGEDGNPGVRPADLATGSGGSMNETDDLPRKQEGNEADDDVNSLLDSIQMLDVEAKDSGKEKKKKKFKFPWGKKDKEPEEDSEEQGDKPKEMSLKDIKKAKKKKEKQGEEKKDSAFRRFLNLLFEEEEEEEPQKEEKPKSENDELLKQLEKEDGGGGKKGKDKKKSKKEKKEKKPPKEKKKKEKKKPEPKPAKIKEKEPPSKPIGKKNLILVFAFCLSILVAVLLLNMILTDFALKQDTHRAAEEGNYSEVYQLLYGKELNEEETQLFNRAALVLQMERKLDIYEFYREAGDRVRALDALLQGTKRYQELTGTDTYGASEELLRIYQVILEYLNLDYGISEERATEINSFEGRDYRRRIYSAAGGTDSEASAGETEKTDAQTEALPKEASSGEDVPLDLLPEEEDIINPEPQTEGE